MQVEIADADAELFDEAVHHLAAIGASKLVIFKDRRQTEGPWLVAFIHVGDRRHVRWTGDDWLDKSLRTQADDLVRQLMHFDPSDGSMVMDFGA